MDIDINFDKIFKIMLLAMKINRSHPYIERDKKWAVQFICMHGIFFLICCGLVYCIIFNDLKNKDYIQACSNGVLCVIFSVVTFNYCVMLWYQNHLKELIERMKEDYQLVSELPFAEQEITLKYAQLGNRVVIIWLCVSIFAGSLFVLKTIVCMVYYKIVGEFKFVHLYDLTYPSFIEDVKDELGPYFALYVTFLYFDVYAILMYIAFAPLGPVFMLHACGQLEVIKKRMLAIFLDKEIDSGKVLRDLREIVIRLQKTYRCD